MCIRDRLSIVLTNRKTTPLRRISDAAKKFGGGDFSARVPVEGDDELAQLAATFNPCLLYTSSQKEGNAREAFPISIILSCLPKIQTLNFRKAN